MKTTFQTLVLAMFLVSCNKNTRVPDTMHTPGQAMQKQGVLADRDTTAHVKDAPSGWRNVDLPELVNRKKIGETKIYRIRSDTHEFVFTFLLRSGLEPGLKRASFWGHVDSDNTVTIKEISKLTRDLTTDQVWDMGDPHAYVADYNPQHVWFTWIWAVSVTDWAVGVIRSDTGGKTFNKDTFSAYRATGVISAHEPSITCNNENDCLLTWGESALLGHFDLNYARFNSAGWCPAKMKIGTKSGLTLDMTQNLGNNLYLLPALSSTQPFTVQSKTFSIRTLKLGFDNEASCSGSHTTGVIIDKSFNAVKLPNGGFHYLGMSGIICPRKHSNQMPTWLLYGRDEGLKAATLNDQGLIESSTLFTNPDPQISIRAGNIDYDGDKFYLFYHKFFGFGHVEHPNTYSICFRTTKDNDLNSWENRETCPIEHLKGLEEKSSKFTNFLQPVGSVRKGNISMIYQKDCNRDVCSLAILRND
jgi:hypothetical protein